MKEQNDDDDDVSCDQYALRNAGNIKWWYSDKSLGE